jgi:hypothetical protein
MSRFWTVIAIASVAGFGLASVALAQAPQQQAQAQSQSTPKGWNYEIKDGKRVPKGNRVVAADGSWHEEIRNGKCVTLKEMSADGEYKESRRCD